MNCEQVQSLLVSYLEGEVTPSERSLIHAHLRDCTVCQQELTLLSTARSRIRSMLQRRAAHAVPSLEAWNRLEAKLKLTEAERLPSKKEAWFTSKAPSVKHASNPKTIFGGVSMNKRSMFSAMAGVVVLAILAVFVARNVIPASARQIMDRAYEAQSQQPAEQGIQHIRTEIFSNLEARPEDQGENWNVESYFDLQSGNFRLVSTDTQTGKVTEALAYDGSYEYNSEGTKGSAADGSPLMIYRSPLTQADALSQKLRLRYGVEGLDAKTMFEKMRNDPNTQLVGKETWDGGLQVYALRSQQPLKLLIDNNVASPTGLVTVYFEVGTYRLAGSRVTMEKDGKELLISSERTFVEETLPAGTSMDWSLSDLQGVTFVDDVNGEHASPKVISAEELASETQTAYLLKTIPEGFSLEIDSLGKRAMDQLFFYEATYTNEVGEYFTIRTFSDKPLELEDASWVDETYTTASGLTLYFVNQPSTEPKFTGGLMQDPNGNVYAIDSTLSRERIKTLLDDLALVK
jgi:hypothetical protein